MKKFKLYWDKDKEQIWLNKMSKEGWGLKKFFLGMYTFEKCKEGEYIYQIDLLDNHAKNKEEFYEFMKDAGIEVVCRWYRWVILRKKSEDGSFEMYSDNESKIDQYKRIRNFFGGALILELVALSMEIFSAINLNNACAWGGVVLIGGMTLGIFKLISSLQIKIKKLEN